MSAENKALMRRWFEEVWNQGKTATIHEMFAAGMECHGFPDPDGSVGIDGFVEAHRTFQSAFSGIEVTIDDLIAEGDRVAVRLTFTARHTGEGLGVAPTGQMITLKGVTIGRIENGKLAEGWNFYDVPGMVARLQAFAVADG